METLLGFFDFWPLLILFVVFWFGLILVSINWPQLRKELDHIKAVTEILAILVGGAWAYQVFIYDEWIKPALQPPHVTITSEAKVTGNKDGLHIVKVKSTLKNDGKIKIHLLSYWLDVHGYSTEPNVYKTQQDYENELLNSLNNEKAPHQNVHARDYKRKSFPVLLQMEPLIREGWWLESGEQLSVERIIYISKQYDVAQINFNARSAKNTEKICSQWARASKTSETPEKVTIITYLKTDGGSDVCKEQGGFEKFDKNNKEHQKLRDRYGLSTSVSRLELSL